MALADFVKDLTIGDIPDDLRDKMRVHLVDTIAAGICGADNPLVRRIRQAFGAECHSMREATLVRGVASHVLELDDTGGCDHSGVAVVPALLELLPRIPQRTLDDVIVAMTVGYEIGRRTQSFLGGYTALNERGWHSTPVCGPIAAAAAGAKILNLDTEEIADAIGLASSTASGGWSFKTGGGNNKALHGGMAAANGVEAAWLAQSGVRGTRDVFEDVWGGLGTTFASDGGNRDALVHDLGTRWVAKDASVKPFPSCASSHRMVQLAERAIVPEGINLDSVSRIDITVGRLVAAMCGETDFAMLANFAQRQLSIPYCVAVTLVDRKMSFEALNLDPEADGPVARLLSLIAVEVDDGIQDAHGGGVLTIRTGSRQWRFTTDDVADPKFNVTSTEQVLAKAESLLKGVGRVDAMRNLRRLADADGREPAGQLLAGL